MEALNWPHGSLDHWYLRSHKLYFCTVVCRCYFFTELLIIKMSEIIEHEFEHVFDFTGHQIHTTIDLMTLLIKDTSQANIIVRTMLISPHNCSEAFREIKSFPKSFSILKLNIFHRHTWVFSRHFASSQSPGMDLEDGWIWWITVWIWM